MKSTTKYYISEIADKNIIEPSYNNYIKSMDILFNKTQDLNQIKIHLQLIHLVISDQDRMTKEIDYPSEKNKEVLSEENNKIYYIDLNKIANGNLLEKDLEYFRKITNKNDEEIKAGVSGYFKEKLSDFIKKYLNQNDSPEGTIISNSNIQQDTIQNQNTGQ